MRNNRRTLLLGLSFLTVFALVGSGVFFVRSTIAHAAAPSSGAVSVTYVGSTSLNVSGSSSQATNTGNEFGPDADENVPRNATTQNAAGSAPSTAGFSVVTDAAQPGFAGINHFQQRTAGTGSYAGTQFSLEPPDQGLCVGNGYVLEAVNDALRVYSATGAALTTTVALNQFYGLAPSIIRTASPVYGPFTSDPKCYFDPSTSRWFVSLLEIDANPNTGALGPRAHEYIAVSQTANPTGKWNVYNFDTTDDGQNGTPSNPGCPCFGDQPLIGADANGFYVTTNEFPISTSGFNGAQVYAISKAGLETGHSTAGVHINAGALPTPDRGGVWYSVQPATTPPGGAYESANNGTEYFLSALQFSNATQVDNRVAVWALTNTGSLGSKNPSVALAAPYLVTGESYANPSAADQKAGLTPLADAVHAPEGHLASNDDRMNQVVYANGKLYAGLNTAIATPANPNSVGIAYWAITPSDPNGALSASISSQGYVAVNGADVIYPSIGVNAAGQGVMTFTLTGHDYYPSAAYYKLGDSVVHIAASGVGPEDGFTAYAAFGGTGTYRWGDYSAAVAGSDGSIWMAVEYIGQSCSDAEFNKDTTCGGTRTYYANWGTFISHVTP
ncbi:MAG TPA: hypothetical protein VFQ25_04440 [Ktedonobacterales bacterium]|nr:hypothetical protein [Ktedonobacterales bacterium]